MSDKVSCVDKKHNKYFIGYKDNDGSSTLCAVPPQMSGYIKCFNETKYICFIIKDIKMLEKYNSVWDKVGSLIKKGFNSEPVCW